ncbi:RNA polymerase factor sigma-32 [Nitratireductor aquimarinus]|uniref:RNA polymerase factor sigma-32 n=1 Tax=Alphaproteobacteria TaxID=28211 RepID=UPI000DDE24D6|nr:MULTISPECIES: RNA polymerase factor sigma-32 [Alphaproteobacteria]MBY6022702.1 RNA polymerase factor sigma-32 [Nitratireductor sp. DP7N14-4]MBN7757910.1 RNA polymerase factor sigma-32 [Nitratireductor aquimarinus]MBN7762374.1 RNA polymerase factor sigma-32 [Nitratireductor aquibiodomus]MBN7777902.1 RNA polymerase factor sigma-32 [Nitratireductor pacificus]MBN7782224.1 RNA polymerase factor sigma-32 [Nitratireductor pacificus]
MQDRAERKLIEKAMKAPYLALEEEQDLAQRWHKKQDQQALHHLTVAHMRLVIAMASRFRNFGLPAADLIQEGHIGLLEAAARFDPERGVRFSTYATWWIRASMQDYVLRNWSIVRGGTSSAQKSLFFKYRRLRAKLQKSMGSPSEIHQEAAKLLGVSPADVAMMDARLSGPDLSLNAPVRDEGEASAERMDFLPSDEAPVDETVEHMIDEERRALWLTDALDVLDRRELKIIRERRLAEDGATLEALGSALGISKERVRQIETRAMEKLRTVLTREHPALSGSTA